ncbi:Holliday junction branch migration protein RuvA [Candidatus Jidaibacter acanthamoebae]|nr:Holliday junction branch migration protein RuvA [Candidatus Jidaibacter acanthamoeba]
MIGKLTGIIDSIEDDHLILDVNGVGYLVYCAGSTLASLNINQNLAILTEMIVKEDQLTLYGFTNTSQKKWFKLLQTVQGVGARMALSILGILTPDQLISAILAQDYNSFKQVSGIGAKLASRIVNELQNKEGITSLSGGLTGGSPNKSSAFASQSQNIVGDALSALSNLGFNRSEAYRVLTEIYNQNNEITLEQLIKQGLATLGRRG